MWINALRDQDSLPVLMCLGPGVLVEAAVLADNRTGAKVNGTVIRTTLSRLAKMVNAVEVTMEDSNGC